MSGAYHRRIELTPLRLAGAVAACIAFVVTGFVLGQWGGGNALRMSATAENPAVALQRASSEYVDALESLGRMPASADSADVSQSREVVINALMTVSDVTSRLMPDDPTAYEIRRALDRIGGTGTTDVANAAQNFIWF